MRKILFLILACMVCFIFEFLIFNYIGPWVRPSLVVILLVFATVFWNVESGILVAVLGGILEDSFGASFGFNMVAYGFCVLATSFFNDYIYQKGSRISLVILLFFVLVANIFARFVLMTMADQAISFSMVYRGIFSDIAVTILIANLMFNGLIRCALKLSV
ncbi:MAG: hypothetical protein HQL26_08095 [Candidatus Omnitrophica bacterium]|nr:hypothetical protein [Candidatus Omnitrophota bacterium]